VDAPPGIPRISVGPTTKPPAPKGLQIRVAEPSLKVGGKPGKAASMVRRRSGLSTITKVGIGVFVVAVAVGGIFTYRIFFPAPSAAPIKSPVIAKPIHPADASKVATDLLAKAAAQAKADAGPNVDADKDVAAAQTAPTPVPTTDSSETQSVMAQSNIDSDVKVNDTHIDTSAAASPEFRNFVANANIGGVFQGTPARALINGRIVREGQVLDSVLGISFDRIDANKKVIYFKDATGAVVSKDY
jgi:hypothetical protein